MNMKILREFIDVVLAEKFKKPRQAGVKKFNYNEFLKADDKELYLDLIFQNSGKGSSRTVYVINTKKCLKLAYNDKGKAQNRAEWEIFSTTPNQEMYAKIFKHGEDFGWLESELVRPLKDENEFETTTGVWFTVFKDVAEKIIKSEIDTPEEFDQYAKARFAAMKEQETSLKIFKRVVQSFSSMKKSGLASLLFSAKSNGLKLGDIVEAGHYGKTATGRVVMLDYGFTSDVWENFYRFGDEGTDEDRSTNLKSDDGTYIKQPNLDDNEVDLPSRAVPSNLKTGAQQPMSATNKGGKAKKQPTDDEDGAATKR